MTCTPSKPCIDKDWCEDMRPCKYEAQKQPSDKSSDTPRTDALIRALLVRLGQPFLDEMTCGPICQHARQLERELVTARAAANSWKDDLMRLKVDRSAIERSFLEELVAYLEDGHVFGSERARLLGRVNAMLTRTDSAGVDK